MHARYHCFFKVVDTNDVNEDEEDESGPLLMTNVIDMSMSDGQQPKEEIVMKLPIHKKGNEVEEMCVLATSEEDPDDVDDWEVESTSNQLNSRLIFATVSNCGLSIFVIYFKLSKTKINDGHCAKICKYQLTYIYIMPNKILKSKI